MPNIFNRDPGDGKLDRTGGGKQGGKGVWVPDPPPPVVPPPAKDDGPGDGDAGGIDNGQATAPRRPKGLRIGGGEDPIVGARPSIKPPPKDGGGTDSPVPPAAPTVRVYRIPQEVVQNQTAEDQEIGIILGHPEPQGMDRIYGWQSFLGSTVAYAVAAHGEGPILQAIPMADGVVIPYVDSPVAGCDHYRDAQNTIEVWHYKGQAAFQETLSGLQSLDGTFVTTDPSAYDFLSFSVIKVTHNLTFRTSIPEFTFDCKGYADVYDSRTGLRGYTENWPLMIREVMSNARWGAGLSHASGFNDATWSQAADDAAVQVFPAQPVTAPTAATGSAGLVPIGNVFYRFTCATATGAETLMSPQSTLLPIATPKQVNVTVPLGDALTVKRFIYRSAGGTFARVGVINNNTSTAFLDNVATPGPELPPFAQPTTTKRWEGGGLTIKKQADGYDWLNTLRAHCLGVITWDAGRYSFQLNQALPGGYVPKVFSEFYDVPAAGQVPNVDPDSVVWSRRRRSERPNEVEVTYVDRNNKNQTASVVKPDGGYTGPGLPRRATYALPGLPDSTFAGRMCTTLYNLLSDDGDFSWRADRSAISCLPFDVVKLYAAGLAGQLIRLRRSRGDDEDYILSGTTYNAASYSDAVQTVDSPIAVGVPTGTDPYGTPLNVSGVSVSQELWADQTGQQAPRGILSYTVPVWSLFDSVLVYLKIDSGPERFWFKSTRSGELTPPLMERGSYQLRLVSLSKFGQESSGVTYTFQVQGKTTPPSNVLDIYATVQADKAGVYRVAWTRVADYDALGYELRAVLDDDAVALLAGGATDEDIWQRSVPVIQTPATNYEFAYPLAKWRFQVKAYAAGQPTATLPGKRYSAAAKAATVDGSNIPPGVTSLTAGLSLQPMAFSSHGGDYGLQAGNLVTEFNLGLGQCTIMLARDVTLDTIEAEMAAAGQADLAALEAANPQAFWAPLPAPLVATVSSFVGCSSGSQANTNTIVRIRTVTGRKIGRDDPDFFPTLVPLFNGIPGPVINFSHPKAYGTGSFSQELTLGTNAPYTQLIVEAPQDAIFQLTFEKYNVPLGSSTAISNGSGVATVTYPAIATGGGVIPEVTAIVLDAAGGAYGVVVKSVTTTTATLFVYDSAGSAVSGATVLVTLTDTGRRSTPSGFSICA